MPHDCLEKPRPSVDLVEKPDANNTAPETMQVQNSQTRSICRKFDRRVLPLVCILYVLSYLDRGNIGNAKTAGAQHDLGLSSAQWSWVLNAFYISYVLFEWTTLFWKILPAHIYVAVLCVCWGAAAMCSGAVRNMAELIVCRVFLDIFEAGFGAGAPYYLSLFYSRQELGFRVSILLGMSPLANRSASALAYGITHIWNSLEAWRLLFIIEGAPNVAMAVPIYFLADTPDKAKFLNSEEQTLALERLETVGTTAKSRVSKDQLLSGLSDYQNYVHTLIYFCCNYSFAVLSNFLPTIVNEMDYSSVTAQGLTAPSYLASFCFCVVAAIFSDKYGKRGWIVALFSAVGGIGYLVLTVVQDEQKTGARYVGVWLATCGQTGP